MLETLEYILPRNKILKLRWQTPKIKKIYLLVSFTHTDKNHKLHRQANTRAIVAHPQVILPTSSRHNDYLKNLISTVFSTSNSCAARKVPWICSAFLNQGELAAT